jgi:Leucine-rich repeat (LRR) protein
MLGNLNDDIINIVFNYHSNYYFFENVNQHFKDIICKKNRYHLRFVINSDIAIRAKKEFDDLYQKYNLKNVKYLYLFCHNSLAEDILKRMPKIINLETNIPIIPKILTHLKFLKTFGNIDNLPHELINLKKIEINQSHKKIELSPTNPFDYPAKINEIPNTFVDLTELDCHHSEVKELPKTLTKIKKLDISNTWIRDIPDNYIDLKDLTCLSSLVNRLPESLTKLEILDCSYSHLIDIIPTQFTNLLSLNCEQSNIFRISNSYINLTYLNCSNTFVKSLPPELINLTTLIINKRITNIPNTYENLERLDLDNNIHISYIPYNLIKIKELLCAGTALTELSKTFVNLFVLDCSFTRISYIPVEFVNLTKLRCEKTKIKELSDKFINLDVLTCSNTSIKVIPFTYKQLISLWCAKTNVDYIPDSFTKLKDLDCSNTQVSEISHNFINLESIRCSESKVTEISSKFDKLQTLSCCGTKISSIPKECTELENIFCDHSEIKSFPKELKKVKCTSGINIDGTPLTYYDYHRFDDDDWSDEEFD